MRRPEQALQIALVARLRAELPKPWLVLHVPNGGGRSAVEGAILKAMGTLPGFPDLLIIGPGPNVLAIELKAPPRPLATGRASKAKFAISKNQDAVMASLRACGIACIVGNDLEVILNDLLELGAPLRRLQRVKPPI